MMFRIERLLPKILLPALLLVSCHESYPALYMEEEPEGATIHPENGELGPVPIVPTLADPLYDIHTRGTGAFEEYDDDAEHWENADFRTFALLTANQFSRSEANGTANYAATDTLHRLLFDQRMRISDGALNVHFYDPSGQQVAKYYNWERQNWKYNFFTYHADNCQDGAPDNVRYTTTQDAVTVGVTIDGSQDILHAMAYHDPEQWDAALEAIQETEGYEDVEDKPLRQYGTELVYSTMSGHRGVQPIFNVSHLLTRLDFMIKGAIPVNATDETGDFRQIVVRKVSVQSPSRGTLMVANDAWTDTAQYHRDLEAGRLLTFAPERTYLPVLLHRAPASDYYPWLSDSPEYQERYHDGDDLFHISSTKSRPLGKSIMLPADTMFRVKLDVDFLDIAAGSDPTHGSLKGPVRELNSIEYEIKYPPGGFQPGHAYTVIISVYGVQQIKGQLVLNAWLGQTAEAFKDFEGLEGNGEDIDDLIFIDEDENDQSDRWDFVTPDEGNDTP